MQRRPREPIPLGENAKDSVILSSSFEFLSMVFALLSRKGEDFDFKGSLEYLSASEFEFVLSKIACCSSEVKLQKIDRWLLQEVLKLRDNEIIAPHFKQFAKVFRKI